jgi:hypothetical protein
MKLVQIVPRDEVRLYSAIVKKEADIRRAGRGTFHRAGSKKRNAAKWKHQKFKGWVNLERGLSEVVTVQIRSLGTDESKLLSAFLGWIDRHFGDRVMAVNIQYR